MSLLPDDVWRRIFEIGVGISGFSFKELCCISISCHRFNRLSCEDPLWSHLLSTDFPLTHTSSPIASSSSSKSLYKLRFEREKKNRLAAHYWALLRKDSQIYAHCFWLREMNTLIARETTKMEETAAELSHLRSVRQFVPAESRILELEGKLMRCTQQITRLKFSYEDERRRLETAMKKLVRKHKPGVEWKIVKELVFEITQWCV